jgi:hypothetical protein
MKFFHKIFITCCTFSRVLLIIFYNLRVAFVKNVFKYDHFWKMLGDFRSVWVCDFANKKYDLKPNYKK